MSRESLGAGDSQASESLACAVVARVENARSLADRLQIPSGRIMARAVDA